jgi:hypothetical protein
MKLLRIIGVNFNYSSDTLHLSDTGEKMGVQLDNTSVIYDFKKAYDSVRRERSYNIITELGVSMKLLRLIKMCLKE